MRTVKNQFEDTDHQTGAPGYKAKFSVDVHSINSRSVYFEASTLDGAPCENHIIISPLPLLAHA